MPSVLEHPPVSAERPQLRVPTPVKRFGYVVAAAMNGVMLWVAHQLLDWGWPGFLTDDFELVLGLVTASFISSIVVNLALAVHHRGRFRALADIVTAAFALAVGLRMWEVFPFDFTGYATDWSGLVRVALGVGIVATGIAILASLVKLVTGSEATPDPPRSSVPSRLRYAAPPSAQEEVMTSTSRSARPSTKVLVAHASRHGSTAEIAERIAERLGEAGLDAVALDVDEVEDAAAYAAYVIGGAAYMFHWLEPATKFVRRNGELLARRPVWLFSSGPVGDEQVDDEGNDLLEVARPKEFDELHELLEPREERVFFGRWDPDAPPVGFAERMMKFVPAGRDALPAGDFRDWPVIDAWTDEIAAALLRLEHPTTT